MLANADHHSVSGTVLSADGPPLPAIPGLLDAQFHRDGADLVVVGDNAHPITITGYFDGSHPPALTTPDGASLDGQTISALAGPLAPGQYAQAGGASALQAVGKVDKLAGGAEVTHPDGTHANLHAGDVVYKGDVIITKGDGAVGIVFADSSTFALGKSGRMVIDDLVYDPGQQAGHSSLAVIKGAFSFASGQVAKTAPDASTLKTPVMTIGIRGTSGAGEANDVGQPNTIVLLTDPDGTVGQISVGTNGGTQTISTPSLQVSVFSPFAPPPPPVLLSANQVQSLYGSALGFQPTAPTNGIAPTQVVPGFVPSAPPPPQGAPGPGGSNGQAPDQINHYTPSDHTGQLPQTAGTILEGTGRQLNDIHRTVTNELRGSGIPTGGTAITVVGGDEGFQSQLDEYRDLQDMINKGWSQRSDSSPVGQTRTDGSAYISQSNPDNNTVTPQNGNGNGNGNGGAPAGTLSLTKNTTIAIEEYLTYTGFIKNGYSLTVTFTDGGDYSALTNTIANADAITPSSTGSTHTIASLYIGTYLAWCGRGEYFFQNINTTVQSVVISTDTDLRNTGISAANLAATIAFNLANNAILTLSSDDVSIITRLTTSPQSSVIVYMADGDTAFDLASAMGSRALGSWTIHATDKASTIQGGALSADTLYGGAGNDTLNGGGGDDRLDGGSGINTLLGMAGDDVIVVRDSNSQNTIDGGIGNDTLDYSLLDTSVNLTRNVTTGAYTVTHGAGPDRIGAIERIIGSNHGDYFTFSSTTIPYSALLTISGGSGVDTLSFVGTTIAMQISLETGIAQVGSDATVTFSGIETIIAGSGDDTITGSSGNDIIYGANGNDTISGMAGNDTLCGGTGNNTLLGGDGDDFLLIEAGNNYLSGGNGNDIFHITATSGTNTILGGSATDMDTLDYSLVGISISITADASTATYTIYRGSGTDYVSTVEKIIGSDQNDQFEVTNASTSAPITFDGGAGQDTLTFNTSSSVTINLESGYASIAGNGSVYFSNMETIIGGSGNDVITGGSGNDTLYGGAGNDTINGGDGNDIIYGNAGSNTLYGGNGNDTLYAGGTNDTLYGGLGNDTMYASSSGTTFYINIDDLTSNDKIIGNYGTDSVVIDPDSTKHIFDMSVFSNSTFTSIEYIYLRTTENDVMFASSSLDSATSTGAHTYRIFGGSTDSVVLYGNSSDWSVSTSGSYFVYTSSLSGSNMTYEIYSGINVYFGSLSLIGTSGDDILTGTALSDSIYGAEGNDTIYGAGGSDILIGGDGDDTIVIMANQSGSIDGGAGSDTLAISADSSDSRYIFLTSNSALRNTKHTAAIYDIDIVDLNNGVHDVLYIDDSVYGVMSYNGTPVIMTDATSGTDVVVLYGNASEWTAVSGAGYSSYTNSNMSQTFSISNSASIYYSGSYAPDISTNKIDWEYTLLIPTVSWQKLNVSVSDDDGSASTYLTVTLTLNADSDGYIGVLAIASDPTNSSTIQYTGTSITLTGTLSEISAYLNNLYVSYQGSSANARDFLSLTVSDGTHSDSTSLGIVYAAAQAMNTTGAWENSANWVNSTLPSTTRSANILANVHATLSSNTSITGLFMEQGSSLNLNTAGTSLTLSGTTNSGQSYAGKLASGFSLYLAANTSIVTGSDTKLVMEDGSLDAGSGGALTIGSSGDLYITGNVDFGHTTVNITDNSSHLSISDNVTITGGTFNLYTILYSKYDPDSIYTLANSTWNIFGDNFVGGSGYINLESTNLNLMMQGQSVTDLSDLRISGDSYSTITIDNGDVTMSSDISLLGNLHLTNGADVTYTGSSGTFSVDNLNIDSTSSLTLSENASAYFYGSTHNYGEIYLNNSSIYFGAGAPLYNESTGTLSGINATFGIANNSFSNSGTIRPDEIPGEMNSLLFTGSGTTDLTNSSKILLSLDNFSGGTSLAFEGDLHLGGSLAINQNLGFIDYSGSSSSSSAITVGGNITGTFASVTGTTIYDSNHDVSAIIDIETSSTGVYFRMYGVSNISAGNIVLGTSSDDQLTVASGTAEQLYGGYGDDIFITDSIGIIGRIDGGEGTDTLALRDPADFGNTYDLTGLQGLQLSSVERIQSQTTAATTYKISAATAQAALNMDTTKVLFVDMVNNGPGYNDDGHVILSGGTWSQTGTTTDNGESYTIYTDATTGMHVGVNTSNVTTA